MRWAGLGLAIVVLGVVVLSIAGRPKGGDDAVTRAAGGKPAPRADGLVEVRQVAYGRSSGRVPAVAAVPRAVGSRGCVIVQYGFGSRKEDAARAWQDFARLGLTTVSIDYPHHGARAAGPQDARQAVHDPRSVAEFIRQTVRDLRGAVGYLERQPYCGRTVAFAGVGLGGVLGALLAAEDRRVKAAVLVATPARLRAPAAGGTPILPGLRRGGGAPRILSPLDPARNVARIAPRPVLLLSGLDDETVSIASARRLQAAARRPKTVVEYQGGHDPAAGPAAEGNRQAIASFLLRRVVEPTYGIEGAPDGTFAQG